MKKISVLHLSQVSGGGVGQYIKLFLKYSDYGNFENYLVLPDTNKYKDFEPQISGCFEFNTAQSFSPIKLLKNVLFIRSILKQVNPDIIYLHSSFAGVIGRIAAIGLPSKIVYNPHGWAFKMNVSSIKKYFFRFIELALSFFTDKYILISESEYRLAKLVCKNRSKLQLIYNGVEVREYNFSTKESIPLRNEKYTIGMIGRLSEPKEYFFFVQFAKEIIKLNKDTFFIIVGDGEFRRDIEDKILEYDLQEHFLITGWVNNPEYYLSLFDQAVLFSKWEGLSLTVAEYMVQKKPILATNIGGINDLIEHGDSGFLIDIGDLDGAVSYSMKIRYDNSLSKILGNNAHRRVVSGFSISKQMAEIENMFKNIITR